MPASRPVWERIIATNKEFQELKPYLFTFAPEPAITGADDATRHFIRVLPKVLGDELVLVCVSRAMTPLDAALELGQAGPAAPTTATVMFEGRTVALPADGVLRDRFEPLARHVYKLRLK
jgi:hypothetical protein